jgi:hypothetical protein
MLVSCLSYSTLKMEVACSSETPVDFQRTVRHYIPEDRTFHNHCYENLRSFVFDFSHFSFVDQLNLLCNGLITSSLCWLYYCWLVLSRQNKAQIFYKTVIINMSSHRPAGNICNWLRGWLHSCGEAILCYLVLNVWLCVGESNWLATTCRNILWTC